MNDTVREQLAREADEAEARAEAEDRGTVEAAPGQRPRPKSQGEGSQVYSVRLPAEAIRELRALAGHFDEPPTALLRRFAMERLSEEEEAHSPKDPISSVVDGLMPLLRQRLVEQLSRSECTERPHATSAPVDAASDQQDDSPYLGHPRRLRRAPKDEKEAVG
ncbi:hypothetical protein EF847_22060 [Actinobacteria bacterium YIM 96077]|uniref:Uncharacterized protein n=1 Tax=Phytoactinopolyspora halophila TaxID=1981511 RepID=A0A329QTS5_9ACTN|nr:hypothetical protein [Phytoactinopolyspora halophila]AYY14974.1 hypothetical protein EF847_22060 [Actinobacteria bacterium YIM 96077]RAW15431.1 hypothetical protein DPM12_09290 [Phytoactinopolyspora halophila]